MAQFYPSFTGARRVLVRGRLDPRSRWTWRASIRDEAVDVHAVLAQLRDGAVHVGFHVPRILRLLNQSVLLEPWSLDQSPLLFIQPVWPRGVEPPSPIRILADLGAGTIGVPLVEHYEVQWVAPEGFVEAIRASYSDVTPTPTTPNTQVPYTPPSPAPTETPLPPSDIFFDHPDDRLVWDGPDDGVSSISRAHCEPPSEILMQYGVPARIEIAGERGFWYAAQIAPRTRWNATGYHHGDWQIWRGSSQESIYLINPGEPDLAFEYRDFGCI